LIPSSAGVKWQAGQAEKDSARSYKLFLGVSKTLPPNPQNSAVSLKQFKFYRKEIIIKRKI
jgi:hypothetical protein